MVFPNVAAFFEILLAFLLWIVNWIRIGLLGVLIFGPVVLATMLYLAKHPDHNPFDNHKQD